MGCVRVDVQIYSESLRVQGEHRGATEVSGAQRSKPQHQSEARNMGIYLIGRQRILVVRAGDAIASQFSSHEALV